LARNIRLKPSVCHGAVLYLLISRNIAAGRLRYSLS
jgi:hypothetical protein